MTPIHLGISTCPNDTFAFHGILEQRVDLRGLEFQTELLDVEELNQRLGAGDFDVAKASFHTAVLLSGDLGVLRTGSALGFGVGPLLLAARPGTHPRDSLRPDNDADHAPPPSRTASHLRLRRWTIASSAAWASSPGS